MSDSLDTALALKLGGSVVTLEASFAAYADIERACDASISQLYVAHASGLLKLSEVANIVYHAARKDQPWELEAIGKRLFEARLTSPAVERAVAAILLDLGYVPEDARKKFEADGWSGKPAVRNGETGTT